MPLDGQPAASERRRALDGRVVEDPCVEPAGPGWSAPPDRRQGSRVEGRDDRVAKLRPAARREDFDDNGARVDLELDVEKRPATGRLEDVFQGWHADVEQRSR